MQHVTESTMDVAKVQHHAEILRDWITEISFPVSILLKFSSLTYFQLMISFRCALNCTLSCLLKLS